MQTSKRYFQTAIEVWTIQISNRTVLGTFTPATANLLAEKDCVGVLFCLCDDVVYFFTYLALCCVYFFKDVLYNCTVHDTHRGSHIIMNHD